MYVPPHIDVTRSPLSPSVMSPFLRRDEFNASSATMESRFMNNQVYAESACNYPFSEDIRMNQPSMCADILSDVGVNSGNGRMDLIENQCEDNNVDSGLYAPKTKRMRVAFPFRM